MRISALYYRSTSIPEGMIHDFEFFYHYFLDQNASDWYLIEVRVYSDQTTCIQLEVSQIRLLAKLLQVIWESFTIHYHYLSGKTMVVGVITSIYDLRNQLQNVKSKLVDSLITLLLQYLENKFESIDTWLFKAFEYLILEFWLNLQVEGKIYIDSKYFYINMHLFWR